MTAEALCRQSKSQVLGYDIARIEELAMMFASPPHHDQQKRLLGQRSQGLIDMRKIHRQPPLVSVSRLIRGVARTAAHNDFPGWRLRHCFTATSSLVRTIRLNPPTMVRLLNVAESNPIKNREDHCQVCIEKTVLEQEARQQ